MTSRMENKLGSFFRLDIFFGLNMPVIGLLILALADLVTQFRDHLALVIEYEAKAVMNRTGYAADKLALRNALTDWMLSISAAYVSYHLSLGNIAEANKVKYTKTKLKNMRDAEFYIQGQFLAGLCTPFIPAMADYNVTAGNVASLSTAADSYKAFIETPNEQQQLAKSFGILVDKEFVIIESILKQIDKLMETLAVSHPGILLNYQGDRQIYDNAAGWSTTPPSITVQIGANSYYQAGVYSYLATRGWRVRSQSTGMVLWGLSTLATEFTNPPRLLIGGRVSMVQSTTLGPNGDILLFQNTTGNPIIVDIWVIE